MTINHFRVLKNSIVETYTKPSKRFETKSGFVSKTFINDENSIINLSFSISANNIPKIKEVKYWLEKNIKEIILQPIYSTFYKSQATYLNETEILVNDDIIYSFKEGDSLIWEVDVDTYEYENILSINGNNVVLENQVLIPSNTNMYLGRQMSIDNNIGINRISNTYHIFNITMGEL